MNIWPTPKPSNNPDKYDESEEDPQPHYFDSIQIEDVIKSKDSTFRGAAKPPFVVLKMTSTKVVLYLGTILHQLRRTQTSHSILGSRKRHINMPET